jgi:tetratricopeptide (TPR) repeat protein
MSQNGRRRLKSISLFLLACLCLLAFIWWAWLRPKSNSVWAAGQSAYDSGHYEESLKLAQEAHRWNPANAKAYALEGWSYFQLRGYAVAAQSFHAALRFDPWSTSAREGLGLSLLEAGNSPSALANLSRLPADLRAKASLRLAMARAYRSIGDNRKAVESLAAILKSDPSNDAAQSELSLLTGFTEPEDFYSENARPAAKPSKLVVDARLRQGYFEVSQAGVWRKFYIAGVDIGPALPGDFATEPPTETAIYLRWFEAIGAMGADTIRVYTLLPTAFYRALLMYNREHSGQPLYLFQEIWFGDPPQSDLFDPAFTSGFVSEMKAVIDAVHGQMNIPIRPGHAGGIYTADVSPFVLGWLIGREVEPHVVAITNQNNPAVHSFNGRYLKVAEGSPSEVWLAKMCNRAVDYEVSNYNAERPVAFVNWPPLDPLTHPSVAPFQDERRMLAKLGFAFAPLPYAVPDTDDGVSLDEEHISPQSDYQAGYFAMYHIYPFNPDFIFLDPAYQQAKDKEGVNTYWGYLQALRQHYRNTPIVIGEYGLSTSLETAHITPSGWDHGGLSEEEQAKGLVRFTGNIKDAGYAGGIVFEWMDEWWKHTWIEEDFEKPFDRNALWHNALDPEQYFGVAKFVPPKPLSYVPIAADEAGRPAGAAGAADQPLLVTSIYGASDPSALYLNLYLNQGGKKTVDWSKDRYVIALNTCDAPCGAEQLPAPGGARVAEGANFLVDLQGPESSRLLIAKNYNPWRKLPVGPNTKVTEIGTPRNMQIGLKEDAGFEDEVVETNRLRFAANGTMYPEVDADRSLLHYGNIDREAPDYSSLGQWYYDQRLGLIRLRLSWGLLVALDPSEGNVFWGTDDSGSPRGKISHFIRFALVSYAVSDGQPAGGLSQIMAASVSGNVVRKGWQMPWPTWSSVEYERAFKKSYQALSTVFPKLTGYFGTTVKEAHD